MKTVIKLDVITAPVDEVKRLRVAAYCRVSTDSDAQLESLEAQKSHYEQYISRHPEWELAGIYYDEGISGTKKEKRPELLRLIADCEVGRIDYIVTKSISRLARNTTDSLEIVRKLNALNIPIFFEKENFNTGDMEGELLLTIMSSMAEGESVSISENNKWSVVRRFQNETFKLVNPPYGYDWDGKTLVINEDQAKHVRWIFAQALAGVPLTGIAKEMNEKGLRTLRGNAWQAATLREMIANERYVGDVLYQKKYTDSHFNRHVNRGEVIQYSSTGHHKPIVSREVYNAANAMIERNRQDKNIEIRTDKYLKRYPFSGKIICGICRKPFKRRVQNGYTAWWCSGHIQDKSTCEMKYIREDAMKYAFVLMLNKLTFGCKQILRPYYDSLIIDLCKGESDQGCSDNMEQALSENKEKQDNLIHLASLGLIDKTLFHQERSALIAEIRSLQKQFQTEMNNITHDKEVVSATRALIQLVVKNTHFKEFDKTLFEKHVDHIRVEARDSIVFVMKCGLGLREKLTTNDGRRTIQCMDTGSKKGNRSSNRRKRSA